MAELKNMTVQALRDLARKALGRGHSKLKTKNDLIEALQAAQKKVAGAAEKAATRVKQATGRTAKATERAVENVRGKAREATRRRRAEREASATLGAGGGQAGTERPSVAARASSAAGQAAQAARDAANVVRDVAGAARQGAKRVRDRFRGEREPDPAGYIVARVAGEAAARSAPHALTESALETERAGDAPGDAPFDEGPREGEGPPSPEAYDERLGDLPWTYGDDALIALPRDPTTLFFYWDHAPETLRGAFDGLDGGRPQLWIYAREASGGWTKVREVDFALESRSYYIHDLDPGGVYRAEIHVVDRAGRAKLLPRSSNEMMLPPLGPSPVIDDRFMRILWSEPLQRLLRDARPGGAFPEDVRAQLARLSDWSRFQSSAGGGVESAAGGLGAAGAGAGASSAGGIGGRPTSPWVRPSSSGMGPWGGTDGKGR
ncbi:MAG: DUF4912 domain-containing protein [Anaeromyxobacteraceae bacterium]